MSVFFAKRVRLDGQSLTNHHSRAINRLAVDGIQRTIHLC